MTDRLFGLLLKSLFDFWTMGCNRMSFSKKKQLRVSAATLFLLVASAGASAQMWERVGPEGGDVISLASAGENDVILGTADGHVFASRDAGEHWELRGRIGKRNDAIAQRIVADARVRTTFYAAVWMQDPAVGGGVFRTSDGGKNWEAIGLEKEAVRALAQSAENPEVLVAGTKTGVFLTTDAGKRWTRISPEGDEELKNLDSVAIDPRDARVVYAGTYHLPWKTVDGGKNWTAIAAGMIDDSDIMSLEIDRKNPQRIYASACSGIYRSENGGAQWTKLQGIPYASRRTQQIAQDPLDEKIWYAGTTEGLWRTEDRGENWERLTSREFIANAVAFSGAGRKLIVGTEEGVWTSRDSGKSFVEEDKGFSHRVLNGLAADETEDGHLLVSADGQGKDLFESKDGGKSWKRVAGPAGGLRALFFANGWIGAHRDGGAAWFDTESRRWKELRFEVLPRNAKRASVRRREIVRPVVYNMVFSSGHWFLASNDGIWISGARAGTFQKVAEKQISGKIPDIESNRSMTELYAIVQNGLMRSTDGGKSWAGVNIPTEAGEAIWLSDENLETRALLVGCSKGVWEYKYDSNWGTASGWKTVQNGLPAAASWKGLTGEIWMVPMRTGEIYFSVDEGKNWQWGGDSEGKIVEILAATGRGVWARTSGDGILKTKESHNSQIGTGKSSISANDAQD